MKKPVVDDESRPTDGLELVCFYSRQECARPRSRTKMKLLVSAGEGALISERYKDVRLLAATRQPSPEKIDTCGKLTTTATIPTMTLSVIIVIIRLKRRF